MNSLVLMDGDTDEKSAWDSYSIYYFVWNNRIIEFHVYGNSWDCCDHTVAISRTQSELLL